MTREEEADELVEMLGLTPLSEDTIGKFERAFLKQIKETDFDKLSLKKLTLITNILDEEEDEDTR